MDKIKKYSFLACNIEDDDDDIIFVKFNENIKVDLAIAQELVSNKLDFAKGKSFFYIMDLSNVKQLTREAKLYMQHPETGLKNILAAAFVGLTPLSVLFANIFIKTRKNFPSKFFREKEDALNWIKEIKNNEMYNRIENV